MSIARAIAMRSILSSCLLALTAPALAQTFVVDVNNGPGTSFTSIQAAVTAVPSGSVLLVRPGIYTPFSIANKSIMLLGDPSATVALGGLGPNTIAIGPLQGSQAVVVRGLGVSGPLHSPQPLFFTVQNCLGNVFVEGLRAPNTLQMTVSNCAAFVMRGTGATLNSYTLPTLSLTSSHAVIEDALYYGPLTTSSSAMITQQGGGSLQLVDSAVYQSPSLPAITLGGGELRLLRSTAILGGSVAVAGTGTVRVDAGVTVTPPFAASVAVVNAPMPSLDASVSGPLQATLRAPAGQFAAIAIALPGQPIAVPGLADAIWLDPATFTGIAIGVVPAAQSFATSIPLPPVVPQALTVAWQGHTWDPASGILITNPSLRVVQ